MNRIGFYSGLIYSEKDMEKENIQECALVLGRKEEVTEELRQQLRKKMQWMFCLP